MIWSSELPEGFENQNVGNLIFSLETKLKVDSDQINTQIADRQMCRICRCFVCYARHCIFVHLT